MYSLGLNKLIIFITFRNRYFILYHFCWKISAGWFWYRFLTFLFIQYCKQTDINCLNPEKLEVDIFQARVFNTPLSLVHTPYSMFRVVWQLFIVARWRITETRSRQMVASHPPVTHNPCNEAGHCEHSKAVVCARGYCPPPPSRDSWHPRSSLGVADNLTLTVRVNHTAPF